MKKIVIMLLFGIHGGLWAKPIEIVHTVKFDKTFIDSAGGKEAVYWFLPWCVSLTLNKNNKKGKHTYEIGTNCTQKPIITTIDNLNGGFKGTKTVAGETDCYLAGRLFIRAGLGPLAMQTAESILPREKHCKDVTFIVKVENGHLKIDQQ